MKANRRCNPRFRYLARVSPEMGKLADLFGTRWHYVKPWRLPKLGELKDDDTMCQASARALAFTVEALCMSMPGGGPYLIDVVCVSVDGPEGVVAGPPFSYLVETETAIN